MTCNRRKNSFRTASVAALLVLGGGCHLAPAEGSTGKQRESPGARSLVDEDYRIRLDWPGDGWHLLDNRSVRAPASDSGLCSYDEEQSLSGCISVTHAPPAPLRAYATDWLNRLSYIDRSTITRKSSDYLGQPAEFFDADGTYSHLPSHVTGVVFYYQQYVYRTLVRGPVDKFDRTRARRFIESVHLLPGKVRNPGNEGGTLPKSGLGFRVASGLYENAIKDFKVALSPSWRVVVGSAQREFDPDADVVLTQDDPDIATSIRVDANHRTASLLSSVQENHRRNFEVELLDERPYLSINGANISARLGRAGNGNMVIYCNFPRGDRSVELTARFAELYRAESLRLIEQVGNAITIVPAVNRVAFEQSFVPDTLREHRVGQTYALRNGCYRNYSAGLGWCHPEGFWSFVWDDESGTGHDEAMIRARNLGNAVSLRVFLRSRAEPGTSLFEALVHEHGLNSVQPARIGMFTQTAQRRHVDEKSFLYSMTRGTSEIAALVTCGNAGSSCNAVAAEAIATRLVLTEPGAAVEFADNGIVDRRLGIELHLPKIYHARSREELPTEGGQRATWESPEASVILLTALEGTEELLPNFSETIDRVTRATVPSALFHQSQSKTLNVAGTPADCKSYVGLNYRFDTGLLRHGRVVVAWLVTSRAADKLQEVLSGLKFVE